MSARPQRLRSPRPLSLAAAADNVPRQLVDAEVPKPPKNYMGRASAEMRAEHQEWLDGQPTRASCLHCPGWSSQGTAAETRQASLEHRSEAHPGTPKRRGRSEQKAAALREAEKRRETSHAASSGSYRSTRTPPPFCSDGWTAS